MPDSNVLFTNNTGGNPDTYAWNFGDGATSTLASPTHTYVSSGVYVVRLTATKNGVSSTVAKVVPILASGTTSTLLATSSGEIMATAGGELLAAKV